MTDIWHVVHVTVGPASRWSRLAWWLPSKAWRQDGWRWRVANAVDKLPGQCWADLVDWCQRSHEDDHDDWWRDLARRVPYRPQTAGCREDRDARGACYCGRLMTDECRAEMQQAGAR